MSDKRRAQGTAGSIPTTTLRDFLRGGYQDVKEPTLVLYHAAILGTFVPGVITSRYKWTPNALIEAEHLEAEPAPAPSMRSTMAPPFLARAIPMSDEIAAPRGAHEPGGAQEPGDAHEPSTRVAYRTLRRSTPSPIPAVNPIRYPSSPSAPISAPPTAPATTPVSADPAWLTGDLRTTRRTSRRS